MDIPQTALGQQNPRNLAGLIYSRMTTNNESRRKATHAVLGGRENKNHYDSDERVKISHYLDHILSEKMTKSSYAPGEPDATPAQNLETAEDNQFFTHGRLISLIRAAQSKNQLDLVGNKRLAYEELEGAAYLCRNSLQMVSSLREEVNALKKLFAKYDLDIYSAIKRKYDSCDSVTSPEQASLQNSYGMFLLILNENFLLDNFTYEDLTSNYLHDVLLPLNIDEKKILIKALLFNPNTEPEEIRNLTKALYMLFPPADGEFAKNDNPLSDEEINLMEEVYLISQEIGEDLFNQVVELAEDRISAEDDIVFPISLKDDSSCTVLDNDNEEDKERAYNEKINFEIDRNGLLILGIETSLFQVDLEQAKWLYENALMSSFRKQSALAMMEIADTRAERKLVSQIFLNDVLSTTENTPRKYDSVGFYAMSNIFSDKALEVVVPLLKSEDIAQSYGAFRILTTSSIQQKKTINVFLKALQSELMEERGSLSLVMLVTLSIQFGLISDEVSSHYNKILKKALSLDHVDFISAFRNVDDILTPFVNNIGEPGFDDSKEITTIVLGRTDTKGLIKILGIERLLEWSGEKDNPVLAQNAQAILSMSDIKDVQLFLANHPERDKLIELGDIVIDSNQEQI